LLLTHEILRFSNHAFRWCDFERIFAQRFSNAYKYDLVFTFCSYYEMPPKPPPQLPPASASEEEQREYYNRFKQWVKDEFGIRLRCFHCLQHLHIERKELQDKQDREYRELFRKVGELKIKTECSPPLPPVPPPP
jgi:hypothetical protein